MASIIASILVAIPSFGQPVSWTSVAEFNSGETIQEFRILSGGTIVARASRGAIMYSSSDEGNSWSEIQLATIPQSDRITDIFSGAADSLFAATEGGLLYVSTDSGITFSLQRDLGIRDVKEWHFFSNGSIIANVAQSLFLSQDFGTTWSETVRSTSISPDFRLFRGSVPGTVYATVAGGLETCCGELWTSVNGGITWSELFNGQHAAAYSFLELSPDSLLVGSDGAILLLNSSGSNGAYNQLFQASIGSVNEVITDANFDMYYAATADGIYRTHDLNGAWEKISPPVFGAKTIIQVSDGALLAGTTGQIFRSEATTLSVDNPADRFASSYNINSVFPNPVASRATIMISAPQSQRAQLELFDILGRRVFSQKVQLISGIQFFHMDLPKNLSNGIYALVLSSGRNFSNSFVVTRIEP